MKLETHSTGSAEATVELGRRLAARWRRKAVVLLIGDLGAGKTTLAKGIASAAAGIGEDDVSSPTFPLIHEYGDPVAVYHIDLYRLDTREEVDRLGLDAILESDTLVLLEWAERFPHLLPEKRIEVRVACGDDESRRIEVVEIGD